MIKNLKKANSRSLIKAETAAYNALDNQYNYLKETGFEGPVLYDLTYADLYGKWSYINTVCITRGIRYRQVAHQMVIGNKIISVPQTSECYYCGKKSRCPYVGDRDDCQITKITDAKWIVGRASFRDSLNNLKRLNEAACNPNIKTAIAELNAVWDLSNLPVLEDQKKG